MQYLKDISLAYLLNSGDAPKNEYGSETLKEAAAGLGIYIGSGFKYQPVHENDTQYQEVLLREYDLVTPGNACKMNSIAKSATSFDFSQCDYLLNFAETNSLAFRGHNTCWANTGKNHYQPAFIRDETDPEKIEAFLKTFI